MFTEIRYIYLIRYIYTQGQTSRHQTLSVLAQLVVLIQVPTRGILDRPLAGLFWFKSWFAGDIHEMTPRASESGLADTHWQHSSLSALALHLQGGSEAGRYCGCCCCQCRDAGADPEIGGGMHLGLRARDLQF
jgi:hypothetical protein